MMGKIIGWRFPSNDNGEDDDLNNPGIESFKNTPLNSLAREICQNSLDAKNKSNDAPVEIHFTSCEVDPSQFPELEDYKRILEACKAYRPDSRKFQEFFDRALATINGGKIPCLMISDYNTSGLMGVGEIKGTDWYKLTKAVGSSDKTGGLGSFGIGKFAPYANSDLRTVFYSTKNLDDEYGFQGVSRLVTHELDGVVTRGTGYFGIRDRNRPIQERSGIPDFIRREKYGTNILIVGFKEVDDWESEIVSAVITNFFYALMTDKLIVKAGNKVINKANLAGIVQKLKDEKKDNYTAAYYEALTSPDSKEFINPDFEGMGKISLKVLVSKDYPKRVAMVRGSGMKIFDKGNFITPLRFAGVFDAGGEAINQYLKSLENPQHDAFLKARSDDPVRAEKILGKLYSWINSQVKSIAEQQASEEADIEGISKFLPDDVDDDMKKSDTDEIEEKSEAANEIRVVIKTRQEFTHSVLMPSSEGASEEEDDDFEFEKRGTRTKRKGGGGVPKDAPGGGGGGDGDGRNDGKNQPRPVNTPVELNYQRLFSTDSSGGAYVVSFVPQSSAKGVLELYSIGEVGEDTIQIASARLVSTNESLPINDQGKVGPFEMNQGSKYTLEVRLKNPLRCALGVSVNAN